MIKIWRSWKSAFGEFSREFIPEQEESWNVTDIYTDGELERIRRAGFNAVWVHAQLNHIVRTGIFPELGEYAVEFRKRLNILTERAARHGIGIYLYLQVPRGLPQGHPLWKKHPECAGMPDIYSDINGNPVVMIPMCTSMPATRKYLQCAAEELARRLASCRRDPDYRFGISFALLRTGRTDGSRRRPLEIHSGGLPALS